MRVSVCSDIHLEFSDLTLPGGDVLILSGDVMEAKKFKRDMYNPEMVLLPNERADRRPDRWYRFFAEECSKYRAVIYVMGNHEHYGFKFNKTYALLKEQLPDNVYLLENETVDIDDVTFVGATLWTDMNNNDPVTLFHMKSMMNDYKYITNFYEAKSLYYKLQPEVTVETFRRSRDYIRAVVENDPTRKYVVVTHHAPSRSSTHPRFAHETLMNGAFSSNLDEFIMDHPQIRVWTHGHTHDPFDYMIGETRIICNPRGYAGYEERAAEFDPNFGFDI